MAPKVSRSAKGYLFVSLAGLHMDLKSYRLSGILDVVTLLTLLCLELLKHAGPNLLGDHLHLAVALPLALSWLDDVPVSRNLHQQSTTLSPEHPAA